MNCRRAKPKIALWIGNDLDKQSERDVRRHLAVCPQCRERARALRTSFNILEQSEQPLAERMHESLWPGLSQQIQPADPRRPPERFNGWMPALAVVVACVTLVLISDNTTPQNGAWSFGDAMASPQIVIRVSDLDLHLVENSVEGFSFLDSRIAPDYSDWPGTVWDAMQENVRDAQSIWEQSTPHLNQRVRVTNTDY